MTRYHMISGGGGSWLAAKLDMQAHPTATHRFVFTDTLYEDADCYRFLVEGVANLLGRALPFAIPQPEEFPDYRVSEDVPLEEYCGNPEWRAFLAKLRADTTEAMPELIWLVEGRDPWEVFRDERFLGNSRIDPCSKILKRQILDKWRNANCDCSQDVFTVGIGTDEANRFDDGAGGGLGPRMAELGWVYVAPLIGTFEGELGPLYYIEQAGIRRPRLYVLGYIHNNCGGFCIKAGKRHYQNRHRVNPDRYAYDSFMEQRFIAFLGTGAGLLTDSVTAANGDVSKQPLTLLDFKARLDERPEFEFEYVAGKSGCGCMTEAA